MNQKITTWLIVSVIFFLTLVILIVGVNKKESSNLLAIDNIDDSSKISQEKVGQNLDVDRELEKKYREEIKNLIATYEEQVDGATNEEWLKSVQKTVDQLLKIQVPGNYRQFHVNLVVIFGQLREGLTGDPEKLVTAQFMLEEIKKDYDWLSF